METLLNNSAGLTQTLKQLDEVCDKHRSTIEWPEAKNTLSEIKELRKAFNEWVSVANDENRKISIGIIGQVKAGKSSFLNAMFFDGKSLLPAAATPMTAALTILHHTDEAEYFTIHFYDQDDWSKIRNYAEEYEREKDKLKNKKITEGETQRSLSKDEIDMELAKLGITLQSSFELRELAKKIPNEELAELLGTKKRVEVKDRTALATQLGLYVGAEGKYSAATKYIELHLNLESLRNITIVDTPGLNDPILSRGRITEQYLAKCDAAFLLSYSGQFMGADDAQYFEKMLPSEGIRRIEVIASKFDSVLMEVDRKYQGNLMVAAKSTRDKLEMAANEVLKKSEKNKNRTIDLQFISSILHAVSLKDISSLTEEELHVLSNLKRGYPDFKEFFEQKDKLQELANINTVKSDVFESIKADKEEILATKIQDQMTAKTATTLELVSKMKQLVEERRQEINSSDVDTLKRQLRDISSGIDAAAIDISIAFREQKDKTTEFLHDVITEIRNTASNINIKTQTETQNYTENVERKSGPFGGKVARFFGLKSGWDKVERTKEVTFADVSFIVKDLRLLLDNISDDINKKIRSHISGMKTNSNELSELGKSLIKAINSNLDASSDSYDPRKIKGLVTTMMNDYRAPEFVVDIENYEQMLTKRFENAYSNKKIEDISGASAIFNDILSKITSKICDDIKDLLEKITKFIDQKANTFVNDIKSMFSVDVNILKDQIEHKKSYLLSFDDFLKDLIEIKI